MALKDFWEKTSDIKGFVIICLTDEYMVDTWPMSRYSLFGKEDKVLEIRIFNKDREERLVRTDISKDFRYRQAVDAGKDFFDEYHFIDIDTKELEKSGGNDVLTTGGGKFNLPLEGKKGARLKIRYFLDMYEDTGHVKISDWRMVDLVSTESMGD